MKPPRCHDCKHRRRRVVTATSKRRGGVPGEPRVHKQPCDCRCHVASPVRQPHTWPGWVDSDTEFVT